MNEHSKLEGQLLRDQLWLVLAVLAFFCCTFRVWNVGEISVKVYIFIITMSIYGDLNVDI